MKNKLSKYDLEHSLSIFHNNIRSINCNLEKLQTQPFEEIDFHFDLIGVTETKIAYSTLIAFQVFPAIILSKFQHLWLPVVLDCLLTNLLIM